MKYAVISSGNKQFKVYEGSEILVDSLKLKADEKYEFPNVLLFVNEDKRKIGNPNIAEVVVTGKVLAQTKGPKIRISKFKAKAKYRRTMGFRATQTRVRIEKIESKK